MSPSKTFSRVFPPLLYEPGVPITKPDSLRSTPLAKAWNAAEAGPSVLPCIAETV